MYVYLQLEERRQPSAGTSAACLAPRMIASAVYSIGGKHQLHTYSLGPQNFFSELPLKGNPLGATGVLDQGYGLRIHTSSLSSALASA